MQTCKSVNEVQVSKLIVHSLLLSVLRQKGQQACTSLQPSAIRKTGTNCFFYDAEDAEGSRGHKSVKNTRMHVDIEHTLYKSTSDEFTVRVAETPEQLWGYLKQATNRLARKIA
jgi:hypothetical protein